MIKVNEVRIGNNVSISPMYHKDDVRLIDFKMINAIRIGYETFGIPLSNEVLEKLGFEKDDTGVDMFDQDYCEWYQKEFPIIGVLCQSSSKEYLFDENTDTLRIKYLHELQNLVFALTGEELEVTL